MPLFRLVGFATLDCGCLVGRYREMAVDREVDYIEEKGGGCGCAEHQRNQLVPGGVVGASPATLVASHA